MDPVKVQAIYDWTQPTSLKSLQKFLGFANFYRRFINNFSSIAKPLTDLTKKGADVIKWSSAAVEAFQELKRRFSSAPVLCQPDVSLPFQVEVDASEIGAGAVLSQRSSDGSVMKPCAFFSRKFSPAERNYDVGNRELLAMKWAFEEWRHWLEGAKHRVVVLTDHKNLTYLESAKRLNPRQARWSLFFSRFDFVVSYLPGSKNVKADALSRSFVPDYPGLSEPAGILKEGVSLAMCRSPHRFRPYRSLIGEKPVEACGTSLNEKIRNGIKRAMKRSLRLSCPFQNACVINKYNRRHCQACRLKKCLDIGMKKELIMSDEAVELRRSLIKQKQKLSQIPSCSPTSRMTEEQKRLVAQLSEAQKKTFDSSFIYFRNYRVRAVEGRQQAKEAIYIHHKMLHSGHDRAPLFSTVDITDPTPCFTVDIVDPPRCFTADITEPPLCFTADIIDPPPCFMVDITEPPQCFIVDIVDPPLCFTVDIDPPPCFTVDITEPPPCFTVDITDPPPCFTVDITVPPLCFTVDITDPPPCFTVDIIDPPLCFTVDIIDPRLDIIDPPPCFTIDLTEPLPCFTVDLTEPLPCFTVDITQPLPCFTVDITEPLPCFTVDITEPLPCFTVDITEPLPCFTVDITELLPFFTVDITEPPQCSTVKSAAKPLKELMRCRFISAANLQGNNQQRVHEPIRRQPDPLNQRQESTIFLMLPHISDLVTYMIKGVINFAKNIPDFRDLGIEDQIALLKGCALEICAIRFNTVFDDHSQTWSCGQFSYNSEDLAMAGFRQFFLEPLIRFHCMLKRLGLQIEEYALMQAISLFSADQKGKQTLTLITRPFRLIRSQSSPLEQPPNLPPEQTAEQPPYQLQEQLPEPLPEQLPEPPPEQLPEQPSEQLPEPPPEPLPEQPLFLCFVLLEALRRKGCTAVPLVRHDIWVILDTGVDMDIQGLCSSMDNLVINVQKIQDTIDQKSMLEPRIPIPDLFFGDRTKFLSFKNNCKLFLALKPHSSGNPVQQVLIIISFLRGDPQDWAFSLAPGDPALSSVDAFFLALGLLYDEPNSVDQAEKNLLALCQGQDDIEVYCQKFRKWSVLTQWNESALAALLRKGLSEALKDVMVGFPMPAGLNGSLSLAIQIGRRLRERKSVHHLAVLPEVKPEPMQCDRTMTRVERQEYRRLNGLCFYCGDSTHAISDCPKCTKRSARSAVIGTVQSKFLLSITLICSLSSFSVMAFVDSGAALNLMDLDYAKRCGFFLEPLRCPIPLRGIDATPLAKNKPQYWAQLTMCMAPAHQEVIRFLVLHNLHDVVVLGLPWLQTHNPVLDWKSMSVSSWGCQGVHGDVPFLSISSSTPSEVPEFLSDYQDVFEEPKSDALPPHRDCDCAINLIPGSKFPKGRLFNLSVPEHAAMRSYVKESLEKGHIRPSSSPLGAGFFFVAKKDGSLRPCIDYRLLNKITVKFQYPLPLLSDLFARIKGASWFTKIDLRGAYNLVRIRQGDEWKTAFNTPEGHFEYLVMPFGLANAPSVFQSFMHDIFREYLDKFLIVYLDDILIFSDDWESHVKQVRMVFQVLRANSLFVKGSKCLFGGAWLCSRRRRKHLKRAPYILRYICHKY
ncbi:unnamed protein product [Ranitomeya imitator]|uniref:Reverse transcriptase n=1 Tax=Ranitomeya imitator TaxID=111125 RepID=A0ABN9MEC8_9NEOB|nr:unnamed protein product [Ranitomeya imitator]